MDFSITPYDGNSARDIAHQMKLWPSLAGKAYSLEHGAGDSIFFYDSPPQILAGTEYKSEPIVKQSSGTYDSPPVFVLIHGLGDEADSWRHIIPLLNAGGYRVLAPDLPGFGRSVATGKFSLKTHADAVLTLIKEIGNRDWGIGEGGSFPAIFMAGNSLGAMVAEEAALRKPGRGSSSPVLVRGLVLIDGSIPGGPSNPGAMALAKLLFSRKWYRAYRGKPERAWASLYPYYADLDSMSCEDREFLKTRVIARVESNTQERAFFATQSSLIWAFLTGPSKFTKKIRQYKGKILLIWGEKDRIIPLSSMEAFKALRSDIKLELVSGAGHLPHQEKPEETARLMLNECQAPN